MGLGILLAVALLAFFLARPAQSDNAAVAEKPAAKPSNTLQSLAELDDKAPVAASWISRPGTHR